jgi:hypothetical protein
MKEIKRVGILTLTPNSNYGGILQSVALYKYLESQGYHVTLINKKFVIKSKFKMFFLSILQRIPGQNIKNFRYHYLKEKALSETINKLMPNKSTKIFDTKGFRYLISEEKYDAVIVGSDQVWRYKYINDGSYNCYFLDFPKLNKTKKISYAASFGIDFWEETQNIDEVSIMLKDFDFISVREQSGVDVCANEFNVMAEHVLDPTMLMGPEFYKEILGIEESEDKNVLCSYILDRDENKLKLISEISNKNKLKVTDLGKMNSNGDFYTIKDWVSTIKDSKFVITDSFHGMVFSIIFNKQFIVIGNKKRGLARFESLLSKFGLSGRILELENLEVGLTLVNTVIDYNLVNEIVEREKLFSFNFLKKSIE